MLPVSNRHAIGIVILALLAIAVLRWSQAPSRDASVASTPQRPGIASPHSAGPGRGSTARPRARIGPGPSSSTLPLGPPSDSPLKAYEAALSHLQGLMRMTPKLTVVGLGSNGMVAVRRRDARRVAEASWTLARSAKHNATLVARLAGAFEQSTDEATRAALAVSLGLVGHETALATLARAMARGVNVREQSHLVYCLAQDTATDIPVVTFVGWHDVTVFKLAAITNDTIRAFVLGQLAASSEDDVTVDLVRVLAKSQMYDDVFHALCMLLDAETTAARVREHVAANLLENYASAPPNVVTAGTRALIAQTTGQSHKRVREAATSRLLAIAHSARDAALLEYIHADTDIEQRKAALSVLLLSSVSETVRRGLCEAVLTCLQTDVAEVKLLVLQLGKSLVTDELGRDAWRRTVSELSLHDHSPAVRSEARVQLLRLTQ